MVFILRGAHRVENYTPSVSGLEQDNCFNNQYRYRPTNHFPRQIPFILHKIKLQKLHTSLCV